MLSLLLPNDLHGVILAYLCPLENPYILPLFHTKFKNSLVEWTTSVQITTFEQKTLSLITRVNGVVHRVDGEPAVTELNGNKLWYLNGKLNRENDKPAIECLGAHYRLGHANLFKKGDKVWCVDNKIHRENDKPAIEFFDGTKSWYIDDKQHRENDKPSTIFLDGTKYWYINGKYHRENDKPAIELANGIKYWFIHGRQNLSRK